MILWIRSLLFNIVFFTGSFVYIGGLWCVIMLWPRTFWAIQHGYAHFLIWCLRWCIGLRHRVEGLEHLRTQLRNGPCLVASMHQSFWETLVLSLYVPCGVFVAKKELFQLPIFGSYLRRGQGISVDRKKGAEALKRLVKEGKERLRSGLPVIVFPQGKRVNPDAPIQLQQGIGMLYRLGQIPVVPAVLDSGRYWGRRSFIKRPGTITLRFLPAIPVGLESSQLMATLQHQMETQAHALSLQSH
jgi:1-acyl-sn-glycerol-3-phosphate acyltransferase